MNRSPLTGVPGREVRTEFSVAPNSDYIHDISYSFDGRRMALCSSSHRIYIWDTDTSSSNTGAGSGSGIGMKLSATIDEAHAAPIWRLDWAHPEFGQVIASCSDDRTVCIWAESSNRVADAGSLKTGTSSDQGKSGAGSSQTLQSAGLWRRRALLTDAAHSITDVQFAPREFGLKLAACSTDGFVRVYEAFDVLNLASWDVEEFATSERPVGTIEVIPEKSDGISFSQPPAANHFTTGSAWLGRPGCTALSWCQPQALTFSIDAGMGSMVKPASSLVERLAVATVDGRLRVFEKAGSKWVCTASCDGLSADESMADNESMAEHNSFSESLRTSSSSPSIKDCAWAPNLCRKHDWLAACGESDKVVIWQYIVSSGAGGIDSDMASSNGVDFALSPRSQMSCRLERLHVIDCSPIPPQVSIWRVSWNFTGTTLAVAPGKGPMQLWKIKGPLVSCWERQVTDSLTENGLPVFD